jgi:Zn-finger nucleic acid-binding protein
MHGAKKNIITHKICKTMGKTAIYRRRNNTQNNRKPQNAQSRKETYKTRKQTKKEYLKI